MAYDIEPARRVSLADELAGLTTSGPSDILENLDSSGSSEVWDPQSAEVQIESLKESLSNVQEKLSQTQLEHEAAISEASVAKAEAAAAVAEVAMARADVEEGQVELNRLKKLLDG